MTPSLALALIVKSTAVIAAALVFAWLLRSNRASARHLVLAAAFGVVLLLPFAAVILPPLDVPVAAGAARADRSAVTQPGTAARAHAGVDASTPSSPARPSSAPPVPVRLAAVAAWAAGTIAALVSLAAALWRLAGMRREGVPCLTVLPLAQRLASEAGIRGQVDVITHEDVSAPMTCGLLRTTILLPGDVVTWTSEEVRRALVHELEHARRADWLFQLTARAACALHWFNPLVWAANRRLALEAERACDDAVVRMAERTDYAEQLVALAARIDRVRTPALIGMARRSDLAVRVSALLDPRQRRGRAGLPATLGAAATAAAVLFAVGPIRAVAASPQQSTLAPGSSTSADHALYRAAERGDESRIAELIAAGANVNAAFQGDGSPLIAAARAGRLTAVRALLDAGADPDLGVDGDGNALIMAAREGHIEIVALLLDRGASIDLVVDGDENALIQASAKGRLPVVKLLVSRGANVNVRVWAQTYHRPSGGVPGGVSGGVPGGVTGGVPGGVPGGVAGGVEGGVAGDWRSPLSMARAGGHADVVAFLEGAGARQ